MHSVKISTIFYSSVRPSVLNTFGSMCSLLSIHQSLTLLTTTTIVARFFLQWCYPVAELTLHTRFYLVKHLSLLHHHVSRGST